MVDEGFDTDPSESEKKPVRTYVSSIPKDDPEKLARENERLKKSLEKEQFFNKLLDQELKDMKNHSLGSTTLEPEYPTFVQKKRLSGGAIFFIFLIIAGGAGYFVYTKFFKQAGNLFPQDFSTTPASGSAINDTTTEAQSQFNSGDGSYKDPYGKVIDTTEIVARKLPALRDDPVAEEPVDNSGNQAKKPDVKAEVKRKQPDPEPVEEDPIEEPAATKETVKRTPPPVTGSVVQGTNSTTTPGTDIAANKPAPVVTKPAGSTAAPQSNNSPATTPPVENRRVLAFYKVTSKANFYEAPDENTMTNSFISQLNAIRLGALEDKNGFIFVVFTNNIGYTKRGWLSKKDLTKDE